MHKDYISVVYNEKDRPTTAYPSKLARYLFDRFSLMNNSRLLEVGCGRGEFLQGFIECGIMGFGVDLSPAAGEFCPKATLMISDVEKDGLQYEDNYFDVVYSKSVIEHFFQPEKMVKECYRVLKPGGLIIILCPDWAHNYHIYFEDYTHRTPFMLTSLRDILLIHGFENVSVEEFRQLPILWGRGAILFPLAEVTRFLAPSFLKPYSKWVRFSKEIMLLGAAIKPEGSI